MVIFTTLLVLSTLVLYFASKTIILLKENGNYKKYLYLTDVVLFVLILILLLVLDNTLNLI